MHTLMTTANKTIWRQYLLVMWIACNMASMLRMLHPGPLHVISCYWLLTRKKCGSYFPSCKLIEWLIDPLLPDTLIILHQGAPSLSISSLSFVLSRAFHFFVFSSLAQTLVETKRRESKLGWDTEKERERERVWERVPAWPIGGGELEYWWAAFGRLMFYQQFMNCLTPPPYSDPIMHL